MDLGEVTKDVAMSTGRIREPNPVCATRGVGALAACRVQPEPMRGLWSA